MGPVQLRIVGDGCGGAYGGLATQKRCSLVDLDLRHSVRIIGRWAEPALRVLATSWTATLQVPTAWAQQFIPLCLADVVEPDLIDLLCSSEKQK